MEHDGGADRDRRRQGKMSDEGEEERMEMRVEERS